MLQILANRTYARLFSAQIVALLGTGLLTVALGLMAYDPYDIVPAGREQRYEFCAY